MYGKLIHRNDTAELYLSNLHRCLSDLSTLFVRDKVQRKQGINHFVLAGDWNSSPQFEDTRAMQKNFFERLFLFGLKDCTGSLSFENGRLKENGYKKTYFGQNSDVQDDWLFADKGLYDTLKEPAGTYEKIDCSDHYPIVAEIE